MTYRPGTRCRALLHMRTPPLRTASTSQSVEALRLDGVGAVGLNAVLRGVDYGLALRGERGAAAASRLGRDVQEAYTRVVGQDLSPRILRDLEAVALVADGGDDVAGGVGALLDSLVHRRGHAAVVRCDLVVQGRREVLEAIEHADEFDVSGGPEGRHRCVVLD